MPTHKFLAFFLKHALGLFYTFVLGAAGGLVCGALILSFGCLIGRSGTTGHEQVGYWDPAVAFIGIFYGGYIGGMLSPLAYAICVAKCGALRSILPAAIGTLTGGILGSIKDPSTAAVASVTGFFLALAIFRIFSPKAETSPDAASKTSANIASN